MVDTLGLLVEKHYLDLGGWLYMCLTRLLTKLCTDMMLGPLKSRVEKTLNIVKWVHSETCTSLTHAHSCTQTISDTCTQTITDTCTQTITDTCALMHINHH